MDTNNNIQNKIDDAFSAIDAIENVNVSPFFKDKTMQRLFAEKEEVVTIWNWFTPKLQLATLACFIVLNVLAFKQYNSNKYIANVNEFAETYGLASSANESLLNLK
ncbi:hypothetical protein EV196_107136 [Mariniflexile fucanivorans]|uniref:Uncharacterized protein n=1 Tax=Mariniflexile fucanivorans TaxID=264023 RepID=A0A4R1REY8_9FLAO|nr:hypothetical protein [Mariniflexile fucanivorans]TCL64429.1 hypothetical protein EV196_107136 [Mariniflexile fucanivorans]